MVMGISAQPGCFYLGRIQPHPHHRAGGSGRHGGHLYPRLIAGDRIRNNVIHDIQAYRYGGWGLNSDEGSSDLFWRTIWFIAPASGNYHLHYGRKTLFETIFSATAGRGKFNAPGSKCNFR